MHNTVSNYLHGCHEFMHEPVDSVLSLIIMCISMKKTTKEENALKKRFNHLWGGFLNALLIDTALVRLYVNNLYVQQRDPPKRTTFEFLLSRYSKFWYFKAWFLRRTPL